MGKPFIVLGDRTSHGGTVLEGDPTATINGKPVARVGDKVSCPKCKGVFPITSGDDTFLFSDKAAARHGDTVACGATLIGSQILAQWMSSGSASARSAADDSAQIQAATAAVATPSDGGICLDCLLKAAEAGSATIARG